MCPNLWTPKKKIFHLEQMENLLFLGVQILKHITVNTRVLNHVTIVSTTLVFQIRRGNRDDSGIISQTFKTHFVTHH